MDNTTPGGRQPLATLLVGDEMPAGVIAEWLTMMDSAPPFAGVRPLTGADLTWLPTAGGMKIAVHTPPGAEQTVKASDIAAALFDTPTPPDVEEGRP